MIYIENTTPPWVLKSIPTLILENHHLVFIDIETTGFSPSKDTITILGALTVYKDTATMYQWFIENIEDEANALKALGHLFHSSSLVITYNGKSFDIPFINKKNHAHQIDWQIAPYQMIDLMHWAKKAFPSSPDYKLKTIEKALKIKRTDQISGKECVNLYHQYIKEGNKELAHLILLHNKEDILHMAPLTAMWSMLSPEDPLANLPKPLLLNEQPFWIASQSKTSNYLVLSGNSNRSVRHGIFWHEGGFKLEIQDHSLTLTLPVFLLDYPVPKSYYLAPEQISPLAIEDFNKLSTEDKLRLLIYDYKMLYIEHIQRIVNSVIQLNERT